MIRSALLALAALLASPVAAAGGASLGWKFDAPHRFVINSQTVSSMVFQFNAEENLDRRIAEWQLNVNTVCNVPDRAAKIWDLECVIEDLAIAASTYPNDMKDLQIVVDEWDRVLTGSTALMRFGPNGRILAFDMRGIEHTRNNDRIREIQEQMRQMMSRAYAGLDLELPAKPVDIGKVWRTKSSMLMDFPSRTGTAGGMQMNSQIAEMDGAKAVIETTGKGVRGPAVLDGRDQIPNLWEISVFSRATFDTEKGTLLAREAIAQGEITPSSQLAVGGNAPPYVQALRVTWIPPGEKVEPFGPSQALDFVPPNQR